MCSTTCLYATESKSIPIDTNQSISSLLLIERLQIRQYIVGSNFFLKYKHHQRSIKMSTLRRPILL